MNMKVAKVGKAQNQFYIFVVHLRNDLMTQWVRTKWKISKHWIAIAVEVIAIIKFGTMQLRESLSVAA